VAKSKDVTVDEGSVADFLNLLVDLDKGPRKPHKRIETLWKIWRLFQRELPSSERAAFGVAWNGFLLQRGASAQIKGSRFIGDVPDRVMIEQETTKKLLVRGVVKAEPLFNMICDDRPLDLYKWIQEDFHRTYKTSRSTLAQFKKRRKVRYKDFREDGPPSNKEDLTKLVTFLRGQDGIPTLQEIEQGLRWSSRRVLEGVGALKAAKRLTTPQRRCEDGVFRKVVSLGRPKEHS
jgi:hypothetical protein